LDSLQEFFALLGDFVLGEVLMLEFYDVAVVYEVAENALEGGVCACFAYGSLFDFGSAKRFLADFF
jgi:hypothetical protein